MEQRQSSTKVAGVDVGKRWLDVAAHGLEDALRVENDAAGISELIVWLRAREVGRVGLEASGGYERGVRGALDAAGFEVVVHQPIEVRRFAQLKRWRAKNDRLDARLIAAATAQTEGVKAAQDPRLVDLAERLTVYEQITDQIVELKTFLESITLKDMSRLLKAQIRSLERSKLRLNLDILTRIKAEADLLARFRLLTSLPGIDPAMKLFAERLITRGKPAKLITVAVMRKLIEAANLVLHRGQPWLNGPAT